MKWSKFTLKPCEVLVTKFKTLKDLTIFSNASEMAMCHIKLYTSGEDLLVLNFSQYFNTAFGRKCLIFGLHCWLLF